MARTVQNVIDHVKRQFGDESGVQITDADIIRWVNTGQYEISMRNEIIKGRATTNVVAGQYDYPLDTEQFLKIKSLHYLGTKLEYMQFQEAEEYVLKEDPLRVKQGIPHLWWEFGDVFTVYPTPQAAATAGLTVFYIRSPADVDAGNDPISLPDVYYNRLLEYVLREAYEMDEDWVASGNKGNQFEAGLSNLAGTEEIDQINVYPRITIMPEDAW